MNKVSIVIPIYNVGEYLDTCLKSCMKQTYADIEIICVNDGATDHSVDIIAKYAAIDHRVIRIDKANGGLPSAREAGVAAASGDYIFHLDGDDNIPLDAIEKLVNVALKESADMVIGDYLTITDTAQSVINSDITKTLTSEEYINYILTGGLFNIWGRLIKTSMYKDNPIEFPHHISMAEDLVQTFQLAHYANKVCVCHQICYHYYIRNTSMSKTGHVIGQLTDRAIFAVLFISRYCLAHSPFARKEMNMFIINFVYTYLCSPYPVSLRKSVLHELMSLINYKDIKNIKSRSKRGIMSVALINLHMAKLIVSSYSFIKTKWKSNG